MNTERRRYYRIDDVALIKYRVVAADELAEERRRMHSHEVMAANLQVVLGNLDARVQELMPSLRVESRAMAEAIDILNRKLSVLARVVALESTRAGAPAYREHEPSKVSLSGGGVGLHAAASLPKDTHLVVDLVLLPSNLAMCMIARVAECRATAGGDYFIGLEFEDMREEDRDALVQHIVRRQSAQLREERRADA